MLQTLFAVFGRVVTRVRRNPFAERVQDLCVKNGYGDYERPQGDATYGRFGVKRDGETYSVLVWPDLLCCPANTPLFGPRDPPNLQGLIQRLNGKLPLATFATIHFDLGYSQVVANYRIDSFHLTPRRFARVVDELVDAAFAMDRVFRVLGVPQ